MFSGRKLLTLVTPLALAAGALTVAAAAPSASVNDPVPTVSCDAEYVSLVVQNGQDQYFSCDDTAGEIRQTFSSKNPWVVDPASPTLFAQPTATPTGAFGQVFIGSSQGVGVISPQDATGEERDSISRSETLILTKGASVSRSFESVQLGVKVIKPGTRIRVAAVDQGGAPIPDAVQTVQRSQGSYDLRFFFSAPVAGAAGFAISATQGEFSLDGTRTTQFWFDSTAPGRVQGLTVDDLTATAVTLSWTNPTDPDLATVVVQRSGTTVATLENGETTYTDTGLQPNTPYTYSVFTRDTSGNVSAAETVSVTTLDAFENGGDTSEIVDYEGSSIQATFVGGDECPVSANNPLPYTLDIDDPANIEIGDSPDAQAAKVAFDFTVVPGNEDISDCRFTLEIFSPTVEILDLFFDPDGPGDVFPEPVEQLRCVEGTSPVPGSGVVGEPNVNVSCIESALLANDIVVFADEDPDTPEDIRDGQQFILTGFFDARGFVK